MARCSSEDLRALSKATLLDAKWNRIHRSASIRERMKALREELADVRSELYEIELLIAEGHQPLDFPAPVEPVKEPYERPAEVEARIKRRARKTA